jgi:hypothetical protein
MEKNTYNLKAFATGQVECEMLDAEKHGGPVVNEPLTAPNTGLSVKISSLSNKAAIVPVTPEKIAQKRIANENLGSPSIGKNVRLKKEGSESFALKFGKGGMNSPTASATVSSNIAELSINQQKLNLVLLVHHKFVKASQGTVGKFLGYDLNGDSVNVVFFKLTIKALDDVEEGQYVKITHGRVKLTNPNFSISTSKYEIDMTNTTDMTVIDHQGFQVPFRPLTISDVINKGETSGIIDCIGKISAKSVAVRDDNSSMTMTINDETGDITIIAFNDESMQILQAAVGLNQEVFAFQRLRYNVFQEKIQLIFRDGAEILTTVDHPRFRQLSKPETVEQDI